MSSEEINLLASDTLQDYILTHENDDEKKLLLKQKTILELPTSLIAQQIASRKKVKFKLPSFYRTKGIVYAHVSNLEQSSSEATAKFKVEVIQKEFGRKDLEAADLTGGFGIDSLFLGEICKRIDYVEPNLDVLNIAKHNHSLFKVEVIHHNETADDFIRSTSKKYDFIFIDPSRRDSRTIKVFRLNDCSPDISELLPVLFEKSDYILLKASPLLDIKQGLNELTGVKKVIVVSVANECKELLFVMQKNFKVKPVIETYNLEPGGGVRQFFNFTFDEEENSFSDYSTPLKYLYEPNVSILKSGAFKVIGKKFSLNKIDVNTHFYTSDFFQTDFPGRIFEINEIDFEPKKLPERKANVVTRNYPMSPDELKKKLKLKDGGEQFVIAFSGQTKKYIILATRLK